MSSTLKKSFVVTAVASSILATGLVATSATSAMATTQPEAKPAVAAKPKPKPLTPAQRKAKVRAKTIARFGVYPLPVGYASIKRYRLGKFALRQVAVAKRWATHPKVRSVRACESGGNYRINTGNGYYGAYQFNAGTWLANGGGRYAPYAHMAPPFAQDHIAYLTWLARGWQPWACA